MRHSKQHQESGVHCDLWVQRLACWKSFENKSTAISCPQFNKYVSFSKLLNVKTKQQIVSVVAEKCQDQVIQQHLCIYVHGCIASENARIDELEKFCLYSCSRNKMSSLRHVATYWIKNTKICPAASFTVTGKHKYMCDAVLWMAWIER